MSLFRTEPRLSPSMRGLAKPTARGFFGRLAETVAYLAGIGMGASR